MLTLFALQLFERAAALRSVPAVAAEFDIDRRAVHRELARLERLVGGALFTEGRELTPLGADLQRHARRVLEVTREAARSSLSQPPSLRVVCSSVVPSAPLVRAFAAYWHVLPAVRVVLESADAAQVVGNDADVVVWPSRVVGRAWLSRRLGTEACASVASPAYLASEAARVGDHPVLDFVGGTVRGKASRRPEGPRIVSSDPSVLRELAKAGRGVAHLPLALVRDDLAAGALVQVEGEPPAPLTVFALYSGEKARVAHIRAFVEHLAAEYPNP